MRYSRAFILALLIALPACAVNKLAKDIERADQSYAYIRIAGLVTADPANRIFVVLYQQTDEGLQKINFRSPAAGTDAFFLVPIDNYSVLAFEDRNRDFVYQPGEPAAIADDPPLFTDPTAAKEELDYDSIPSHRLQLSASITLPIDIDLSTQALEHQVESAKKRSYLKITSWDDPAFAEDNVRKGLWQPLTFLEETGFGLYLLEELDPDKQPLLLVHGINGSPTNFRELASQLGDRYQLLLFQYPSGFPLEHSAYVLHRAMEDFLGRFGHKQLHIIAHSMGGLVSRDALIQNSTDANAQIGAYITLATPWGGHEAARMGVEWSPAVAPVWKSMVPNSHFLQQAFASPLADNIDHHLFFSYARKRNGPSAGDDGVVTVGSQLHEQAQREARALYGIKDNHNGILTHPCSVASIQILLAGAAQDNKTPLPSCIPTTP